jgi:hypothetical protein
MIFYSVLLTLKCSQNLNWKMGGQLVKTCQDIKNPYQNYFQYYGVDTQI